MALDSPNLVVARLRDATAALGAAHAAASESEGDRHNLNGPVRDAIFGLNTTVDSLAQMIDEAHHKHTPRRDGSTSRCADCGELLDVDGF